MARAHGLLTQTQWRGASLRRLVFEELQPYIAGDSGRLAIGGNDVLLQPKAAVAVALVVHELATNAAKHGALSTPAGHVSIDWRIEGSGGERRLGLSWTESGGPRVATPARRGFGTMLIETSLTHEFDAEARLEFPPEGVRCVVSIPLHRIAAAERDPVRDPDGAPPPTAQGGADLAGARVLVVEDDALIGLDIRDGLEDAGATVVGPIGRLDQAFEALADGALDAAVLDVNLAGEHVFPLADELAERGIPFLFLSGYDKRTVFPERYLDATALQKPVPQVVISAMVRRIVPRKAEILT
jgi:CheY-like chemotaxis protein